MLDTVIILDKMYLMFVVVVISIVIIAMSMIIRNIIISKRLSQINHTLKHLGQKRHYYYYDDDII